MKPTDDELDLLLKRLHLANARRVWRQLVERAENEQWSYRDFLTLLVSEEIAQRQQTRLGRLSRRASFPFFKTIDDFDFTLQSTVRLSLLGSALSPDFVTEGRSLILVGKPGRGKTHLAVAISYRAIQNGFDAFFVTAAQLIDDLSAAFRQGRLADALAAYTHPALLVVDEVGYLTYGTDAANMLFHVVNDRHRRKRSMVFTTNKPTTAWGKVLHDEDLAQAIVDRVLERGRLLTLDGPSMRTKHLRLDEPANAAASTHGISDGARISGIPVPYFPEPPTIAVDLAKNVFEIGVSHEAGKVSEQKRVNRAKLVSFFAKRPEATVLLEACGSSHYWARKIRSFGHTVVLLPPHLVKPYRRGNKTDRADTKALLEAYRNEEIRAVPIKSVNQHVLAALHRLRSGWLSARTARINAVRGILRELGHFIPKGAQFVLPAVTELIEDPESDLPKALRSHLEEACAEIRDLKSKCVDVEHELQALSKQLPEVQRLLTVPGIGLLTATAIVGFVGDLRRFGSGRRFASYLGVVPKENSSGDVRRLGRITKRGDSYIRSLLTHGGRSVLRAAHVSKSPPDKLRAWALKVHRSRGHNKAAIAVANKLARIVWAVSAREENYKSAPVAA